MNPGRRRRARWLGAVAAAVAVAPGCVLPTRQGVGVYSLTATLWEAIEERSRDGWDVVPVGDLTTPTDLRWVSVQGLAVEVGAEWSDGRLRVHSGAVRLGDPLPALIAEEPEATARAYDVLPSLEPDEAEDDAAPADVAPVDSAEAGSVEVGGDGSLVDGLRPGDRARLRGDLVVVEGREVLRLEERMRLDVSHSPLALAVYGTGGVLATPLTAGLDALLFVVGLPVLGYALLTAP